MSDGELMDADDVTELFAETLLEGDGKFTVRFHDDRVEMEQPEADLTLTLYSERPDPEGTVKGDIALFTGSRMTITRDGETSDVKFNGIITWELPAEVLTFPDTHDA